MTANRFRVIQDLMLKSQLGAEQKAITYLARRREGRNANVIEYVHYRGVPVL
jgi:hypothetical protein